MLLPPVAGGRQLRLRESGGGRPRPVLGLPPPASVFSGFPRLEPSPRLEPGLPGEGAPAPAPCGRMRITSVGEGRGRMGEGSPTAAAKTLARLAARPEATGQALPRGGWHRQGRS